MFFWVALHPPALPATIYSQLYTSNAFPTQLLQVSQYMEGHYMEGSSLVMYLQAWCKLNYWVYVPHAIYNMALFWGWAGPIRGLKADHYQGGSDSWTCLYSLSIQVWQSMAVSCGVSLQIQERFPCKRWQCNWQCGRKKLGLLNVNYMVAMAIFNLIMATACWVSEAW